MDTKLMALCINLIASLVSLVAAWFWFKSAKTNLPAINPTTGQPMSPVSMLELYRTVREASRINKIAAFLTGLSVIMFSLSGFLAYGSAS
ncbi:hypothetical protein SJS82_06820 [Aeromonas media]|uniref:Uncharacterized protein n=1 Tax=Aeromonas media TaxID=651 RepID=A0AAP6L0I6_AERME|nr:hypothetical protein [Aeromonas media]MDX7921641.1 hypothetical protein [Aeromonas media]